MQKAFCLILFCLQHRSSASHVIEFLASSCRTRYFPHELVETKKELQTPFAELFLDTVFFSVLHASLSRFAYF